MKTLKFILIFIYLSNICLVSTHLPFETTTEKFQFDTVDFSHETCQRETISSKNFTMFYPAERFYNRNNVFELLVRFMGIADGHISLSTNASSEDPRYHISLGSYNNKVSEIRRSKRNSSDKVEFKMNTPGILSEKQYRGFLIRYNKDTGIIYIYSEGSELPLLHLVDTNPLNVNYFSFATWSNRVIQVAFNCQAKDSYSNFNHNDMEKGRHKELLNNDDDATRSEGKGMNNFSKISI